MRISTPLACSGTYLAAASLTSLVAFVFPWGSSSVESMAEGLFVGWMLASLVALMLDRPDDVSVEVERDDLG